MFSSSSVLAFLTAMLWLSFPSHARERDERPLRELLFYLDQAAIGQVDQDESLTQSSVAKASAILHELMLKVPHSVVLTDMQGLFTDLQKIPFDHTRRLTTIRSLRQKGESFIGEGLAPTKHLAPNRGKTLYSFHCEACHGSKGQGDGVLAPKLKKPLKPLTRNALMEGASVHSIYNMLLFGYPDSVMPAFFPVLDNQDLWEIAFYTRSLIDKNGNCPDAASKGLYNYFDLATLTDTELRHKFQLATDAELCFARQKAPFAQSLTR